MPTAQQILDGLSRVATEWTLIAVLWHLYFAVVLVALLSGVRLSGRLLGVILVPPLVSVSALAWAYGNPFNGTVFALAAAALLLAALRLPGNAARFASRSWIVAGSLLFLFGWVYPHFVEADSYLAYLYAAPLGLIPCPTLSMLTGVTLMVAGLQSFQWSLALGIAGLFYGVFGSAYLGVTIDWVLTAGALALLALCWRHRRQADFRVS